MALKAVELMVATEPVTSSTIKFGHGGLEISEYNDIVDLCIQHKVFSSKSPYSIPTSTKSLSARLTKRRKFEDDLREFLNASNDFLGQGAVQAVSSAFGEQG